MSSAEPPYRVQRALGCPYCERTFDFALLVDITAGTDGKRVDMTPDAAGAYLSLAGHVQIEHPSRLDYAELASWAHEQAWAASYAALFELGEGLTRHGFRLRDDGQWKLPA